MIKPDLGPWTWLLAIAIGVLLEVFLLRLITG